MWNSRRHHRRILNQTPYMNQTIRLILFFAVAVLLSTAARAQLTVEVSRPKVASRKVVVPLAIKNGFTESISSARAVVFLLDDQGKIVGRDTRWLIGGGKDLPALAPGATNAVNFVVSADKPITTTNLTARVSFTRLVLESGKQADISKAVTIRSVAH